ncbi:MAG: AMP-binding protein [Clostridia bacterium]|nr:AMP-binding protein [Clostridia bacterium]
MKLAFSTKNWKGYSWSDFCLTAQDIGFKGIEVHDIKDEVFTSSNGPLNPNNTPSVKRKLKNLGLTVSAVDYTGDLTDFDYLAECISAASTLASDFVKITYTGEDNDEKVVSLLKSAVELAEKEKVILLIETTGIYSDTTKLCGVLNQFASDWLCVDWNMHDTYFIGNEDAETTIKNLGSYVKLVHVADAVKENDKTVYTLIGDGELPFEEMMNALRSINYVGFVSIEWAPDRIEEINDLEVIFPHFVNFMRRFRTKHNKKSALYHNVAGTGKYIWPKETLIEYTFSQLLDRVVEEFPDQYAFKYTTLDYTRTYSEFREDVDTFARSLIALGVKPGDKVAVWATNIPQWFIAFWATTKIGAILVTVNTAYKIHEIEYLLKQSDTHTLITIESCLDSNYAESIAELCPELQTAIPGQPLHCKRLPFLRNIITVGYRQKGCLTWDEAVNFSANVPVEEVYRRAANVDCHDVANMQYTSGTTGFPKGVMLTHYNIVNNGKCIGDRMDLSTADRMMVQVPMFHCFGMVLTMTSTMSHGGTLCPLPYFSAKSSLACINLERITCFNGVPTMFIAMFQHEDFAKTDFSYMRTGIMAGANCPADLMKKAAKEMNMTQILSVYGQTEASPGCTMGEFTESLEHRTETVGSAFPNVECKIIDPETGEDLPDGENGEFVARGYNIMKGYYKMPKATASAIDAQGWLHTGDIACRRPDGYYLITGRLKDMIIRGGENIYPREIEEFIFTHEAVEDVQVIGVPDKRYGEEIMASIILKDGYEMTVEEMSDYILSHMARHKVPRYIEFVSSFPKNAAGKILKYKMREEAIEKLGLQK